LIEGGYKRLQTGARKQEQETEKLDVTLDAGSAKTCVNYPHLKEKKPEIDKKKGRFHPPRLLQDQVDSGTKQSPRLSSKKEDSVQCGKQKTSKISGSK